MLRVLGVGCSLVAWWPRANLAHCAMAIRLQDHMGKSCRLLLLDVR